MSSLLMCMFVRPYCKAEASSHRSFSISSELTQSTPSTEKVPGVLSSYSAEFVGCRPEALGWIPRSYTVTCVLTTHPKGLAVNGQIPQLGYQDSFTFADRLLRILSLSHERHECPNSSLWPKDLA